MPHISVTTNKTVSRVDQDLLKQTLGEKIELIPRKTEKWLMCQINDNANLYFGGSRDDAVYIEVKLFGAIDRDTAELFTAETTTAVSEILGIQPDRIYISYFPTTVWGFNGRNF